MVVIDSWYMVRTWITSRFYRIMYDLSTEYSVHSSSDITAVLSSEVVRTRYSCSHTRYSCSYSILYTAVLILYYQWLGYQEEVLRSYSCTNVQLYVLLGTEYCLYVHYLRVQLLRVVLAYDRTAVYVQHKYVVQLSGCGSRTEVLQSSCTYLLVQYRQCCCILNK